MSDSGHICDGNRGHCAQDCDKAARLRDVAAKFSEQCNPPPAELPSGMDLYEAASFNGDWESAATALRQQLAASEQARQALVLQQRIGPCDVCWTSSWVPVPADDPDAVTLKDGSYARCDQCWIRSRWSEQMKARQEAERERDRWRYEQMHKLKEAEQARQVLEVVLRECREVIPLTTYRRLHELIDAALGASHERRR